jgi:uncharacterized membrane protein YhiD involved in acid resistance
MSLRTIALVLVSVCLLETVASEAQKGLRTIALVLVSVCLLETVASEAQKGLRTITLVLVSVCLLETVALEAQKGLQTILWVFALEKLAGQTVVEPLLPEEVKQEVLLALAEPELPGA